MQKRMLQAERDREAGLAANLKRRDEFNAILAAEQAALAGLEADALAQFRGYRGFQRGFTSAYENVKLEPSADENQSLARLQGVVAGARRDLAGLRGQVIPRLLRYWPLWLALALCEVPLAPIFHAFGHPAFTYPAAAGAAAATFIAIFLLRYLGQRRAAPLATSLSANLALARALHNQCQELAEAHYTREAQRFQDQFRATTETVNQELKRTLAKAGESRVAVRMDSDEKTVRITARHKQLYLARMKRLDQGHPVTLHRLRTEAETRRQGVLQASQERETLLAAQHETEWRAISEEWKQRLEPTWRTVEAVNARAEKLFPPWTNPLWRNWVPPTQFAGAVRFARVDVDVAELCEGLPKDSNLALPGPAHFPLALSLAYPEQGSILLETDETGHEEAIGALNNIILRLLATAPPGRLNFSIIDPVGLGQNFAGIMHLADYEEQIINSRIWTQSDQIEQRAGRPQRAHGEGHPDVSAQ